MTWFVGIWSALLVVNLVASASDAADGRLSHCVASACFAAACLATLVAGPRS